MTGLITDYTNRITSEHRNKPKFLATVTLSCQPYVDAQAVINQLVNVFDLDLAVGVQLDQVGLWIGISRVLTVPLANVFFSWDTTGLGWDQGVWQGEFDPTTGVAYLDDASYRAILKLRVAYNSWDGTNKGLASILINLYPTLFPGSYLIFQDNANMTVTFIMGPAGGGALPIPLIQQAFLNGLLTPKLMTRSCFYSIA